MATAAENPTSTTTKIKLKLMIDKARNKVLFAEAKKDFVDFLIYILSLPLGAVANYSAAPSYITKLYDSVKLLEPGHLKPADPLDHSKTGCGSVLVPHLLTHVPVLPRLTPPVTSPVEKTLYNCPQNHRFVKDMVSGDPPRCGLCPIVYTAGTIGEMKSEVRFFDSSARTGEADYVKEMIAYMVTDDLSVSPLNSAAVFHAVRLCDDPSKVEVKEVEFGFAEAVKLLKASLHSDAPLTSVFLRPQVKNETD